MNAAARVPVRDPGGARRWRLARLVTALGVLPWAGWVAADSLGAQLSLALGEWPELSGHASEIAAAALPGHVAKPALDRPVVPGARHSAGILGDLAQRWSNLFLLVRGPKARLGETAHSYFGIGVDRLERVSTPSFDDWHESKRKWVNASVAWQPRSQFTISASYSYLLMEQPWENPEFEFAPLHHAPALEAPLSPAEEQGIFSIKVALRF